MVKAEMSGRGVQWVESLGLSLLLAFFALGLAAGGCLVFGFGWSSSMAMAAYVGGAALGSGFHRGFRDGLLVIGLHAGIVLGATGLAAGVVDVGWDSVQTHQVGVVGLQSGWNPLKPGDQSWLEALPEDGFVRSSPEFTQGWLHFNLLYVAAALFAELPWGFEGGKGVQLIWALALFLNALTLLRAAGIGQPWRGGVAAGLSLNPVIGYQAWTLYQDLGVAVFSSLAVLAVWVLTQRTDGKVLRRFVLAIALLVLVKRSGIVVALPLVILAGAVIGWRLRPGLRPAALGLGLAGGVVLFGVALGSGVFRGYEAGQIRDMILNPAEFDRERGMKVPEHLAEMGRPELFARSLFESTHVERGADLKVPMTWAREEWRMFRVVMYPGYTSGGFGPLFSGGWMLSLLAAVGWRGGRPSPGGRWGRWALGGLLLGMCMVLPSSFARWVPFVWCLPWLAILGVLLVRRIETDPVRRWLLSWEGGSLLRIVLAGAAGGVLIANGVLVAWIHHDAQREATAVVEAFFEDIGSTEVEAIPVAFGRSIAVKRWFWEREVPFRAVDSISPPFREVPFTWARIPRHLEAVE